MMNVVERNIVFLYPLSEKLKELKESLDEDESYVVYELDAINEYTQLVGVLEYSITFSSDLKKTEQYLETSKSFIKNKNTRNIILQDNPMLPHIFNKYQKSGLNEQIKEETPAKNILHKINVFFNVFDQQLKREEEQKNKASTDFSHAFHFDNQKTIDKKKNENEKLHVEKMAIIDDEPEAPKKRKGFDTSFLSNNLGSGKLGSQKRDIGFMNSMFDQLQRKNVMQFNPSTDLPNLKKVDFKSVDQELKRKSYNPLNLPDTENAKKRKKLDFNGANHQTNRKKFEDVEKDLNKKRGKFEPVERDLDKKRKQFEEQLRELDQRRAKFDQQNLPERKKRDFKEIDRDLNQRKAKFEPIQREVERKKLNLEEIEREIQKKKIDLPQLDEDDKSKPKWDELHELNRKKTKLLDELEQEQKKAATFLEQELEGLKKKKLELDDLDNEKKKNPFEEQEMELEKKKLDLNELNPENEKKKLELEEADLEKKKYDFNEADIEKEKKKSDIASEIDKNKKSTSFEEIAKEPVKRDQIDLETNKDLNQAKNNSIEQDKQQYEKELDYDAKKDLGEQTLDYSAFKKKKDTNDTEGLQELDEGQRRAIQQNLEEPELFFYDAQTYGLEFLVFFNHFLLLSDIQISKLFKFIHFAFIKEYSADISVYLNTAGVQENMLVSSMLKLHEGHIQAQTVFSEEAYIKILAQNETIWATVTLPTWEDETFELEPNSFIYPYYQDGTHLAFAIVHFKSKVKGHDQAKEVESLLMMLKGPILAALKERKSG